VILGIPRIAQLMRDPARSHESIARSEDELLISNNDFQFSGKNKVGLVLTRVGMPRHANPRCEITSATSYAGSTSSRGKLLIPVTSRLSVV
jgi:hypothetical protein